MLPAFPSSLRGSNQILSEACVRLPPLKTADLNHGPHPLTFTCKHLQFEKSCGFFTTPPSGRSREKELIFASENLEAILERIRQSRCYASISVPDPLCFRWKLISCFLSFQSEESWLGYSSYLLAIAECLAILILYVAMFTLLGFLHSVNVFSFEIYCFQVVASGKLSL
jgi:hypothetical protein